MPFDLEHPAITNALRTGYPDGKEPEPPICLLCGKECEKLYKSRETGEIVGCDLCIEELEPWEAQN